MSHVQTPKEALSPNGYPTDVTEAGHVAVTFIRSTSPVPKLTYYS